jgi:hypothetical protein
MQIDGQIADHELKAAVDFVYLPLDLVEDTLENDVRLGERLWRTVASQPIVSGGPSCERTVPT